MVRVEGLASGAPPPRSDTLWRVSGALGSFAPAIAVMSGVVRDRNPAEWAVLAGMIVAAVSAGALAWRLGRFSPGWAIASGLVVGVPGLLLCTLESRVEEPLPEPVKVTPNLPPRSSPRERAPAKSADPLDAVVSIQFADRGPLSMFVSAYDPRARCLEIQDAVQQDGPTAWIPASETNGVEMVPGRGTPRSLLYGVELAKGLGIRPASLRSVRVRYVLDPDTVLRVHALGANGLVPEKLSSIPLLRYARNVAEQLGHQVRAVSRSEDAMSRTLELSELLGYWTAFGDAEKLGERWKALAVELGIAPGQPLAVGYDVVFELEAAR